MSYTESEGYREFSKLHKLGIHGVEPCKFAHVSYPAIAVRIEAAIGDADGVRPIEWNVNLVSKEGAVIVCSDWAVEQSIAGQRVVSFIAHMRLPKDWNESAAFFKEMPQDLVTSFADFNFSHGNEAFGKGYSPNVLTIPSPGSAPGDLGWYLPCRFADRLGEALSKMNAFVMSGVLEDALIYGVMVRGEL